MSFDISTLLNDMKNAAANAIKDDIDEVPEYLGEIIESEKESLAELADARFTNQISDDELMNEIEREKKVIEVEMLTIQIMTKAMAQKAINAAMKVLAEAIKIAL